MRNPSNPPVNVKYLGCTAKGLDGLTVVSHARDKFLHPHLWNLRSGPVPTVISSRANCLSLVNTVYHKYVTT